MTLDSYLNSLPQELASSIIQEFHSQPNQNPGIHGQMSTKEREQLCNLLGEQAEKHVFLEASRRGAEVFPNFVKVGKTDCVLKIYGQLYEFNVKCAFYSEEKDSWQAQNVFQISLPVWPIVVEPRRTGFIVRWSRLTRGRPRHDGTSPLRCPPGLEAFWND